MPKPKNWLTGSTIRLYAVNTGSLYPTHCKLARNSASEAAWRNHVVETVMPLYSREIEMASAKLEALNSAARQLKDYYERHVAES